LCVRAAAPIAGDTVACVVARQKRPAAALTYRLQQSPSDRKHSAARSVKSCGAAFLALAFFVVLSRVRSLVRPQQIEASGIDIMLVLDVSGSMLTKDFTIGAGSDTRRCDSRSHAKIHRSSSNDRIGIIAFAGRHIS